MKILLCVFLALAAPLASAGPINGQLKSTTDDYPYNLGPPTSDLIPYVSLQFEQKVKFSHTLHLQWKAFALTNTASKYPPENFYGDIPELYLEKKWGESKWRIGLNTVNWAVVDVNSPSDTVNTIAMFHPLRQMKEGAPMVEGLIGPEAFNLDLIYIPVQRRPLLPSKDSRWLPRDFLVNVPSYQGISKIDIPQRLDYEFNHAQDLSGSLQNNYGAKLASHLGSLDTQITYFEGAAPTPKILPTINATFGNTPDELIAMSPIYLTPITYRVRTTGFGFAWAALDNLIIRGESAYQSTVSQYQVSGVLQPWSWSNVLALETNVSIGSSTLTILGQYYYAKNPQAADNFLASSYRLFDNAAILGGRLAYSDTLTVNLSALYEPDTKGVFAQGGFDEKLSDHLSWGLSYHEFAAQKDSLLKTFEKNSHGTLDMIYYF